MQRYRKHHFGFVSSIRIEQAPEHLAGEKYRHRRRVHSHRYFIGHLAASRRGRKVDPARAAVDLGERSRSHRKGVVHQSTRLTLQWTGRIIPKADHYILRPDPSTPDSSEARRKRVAERPVSASHGQLSEHSHQPGLRVDVFASQYHL